MAKAVAQPKYKPMNDASSLWTALIYIALLLINNYLVTKRWEAKKRLGKRNENAI